MKINQNNDITIYRGETAAIDFKISQRSDYYVPFIVSDARVNPMICITIGSTRRETDNIVSTQLWLDLAQTPRFSQTTITDLGEIDDTVHNTTELLKAYFWNILEYDILYQFTKKTEVAADNSQLHYVYVGTHDTIIIDDYEFKVTMALDETITLNLTNIDYYYQIELMDTEPMIAHLQDLFIRYPTLITKMPNAFITSYASNTNTAITEYLTECITLVTKTWPNHWGHRITNPLTSPVASVSKIQILQPPRKFTVQLVVK